MPASKAISTASDQSGAAFRERNSSPDARQVCHPLCSKAIRTGKQLTPDIETGLKSILDEFAKNFA